MWPTPTSRPLSRPGITPSLASTHERHPPPLALHRHSAGRRLPLLCPRRGPASGLTGWVANNWDGSVTLEAQGERAALDALVPLIERSNRWARIENIEVTTLPVKEHEYGFGERSGE